MAAMSPGSSNRPSGRAVVLAFGVAIAVSAALVAVALFLRNDNSAPAASPTPVVDLQGIPQDGAVLGSPDAKVTLIEYADLQCPACRRYTEGLFPSIVDGYVRPGRANTEFRGFPFIGPDSVKAHRFLLAAGLQSKLWELQEALYRNQGGENDGWVTDELLRRLAGEIDGLDAERLFADAETDEIQQAADAAAGKAADAGIAGTPTLLIKIGDSEPYLIQVATVEQMQAALDAALQG